MKKNYVSLILMLFVANSFAQVTYTTVTFGNWDDPAHWVGGVVPPATINADDVVNLNHNTFITSKNLINNGTININAYVSYSGASVITNNGKLIVTSAGTAYTVDETSSIVNNYAIDNDGNIYNVNVFTNNGYIFNQGDIFNFQRLFYDGTAMQCSDWGTLRNNNVLCNNSGGFVNDDCGSTTTGNTITTECSTLKTTIMNATLGMTDVKPSNFKLYPNPTTGLFTINFDNQVTVSAFEVFDSTGKKISAKYTKQDNDMSIDISDFSNGLYVLKITTADNNQIIKKILKN